MVDEERQNVASEPTGGAAVDRNREGEVVDRAETAPAAPAAETPRAEQTPRADEAPPAEEPPRSALSGRPAPVAGRALAYGALGGLIVSALAVAGGYYALGPKADLAQENAARLGALEAQAQREGEDAERRSATTSALDKRIGALESANAAVAPKIAGASEAAQSASDGLNGLRTDLDAARGEVGPLAARVAKLESRASQTGVAAPEIAALAGRVDKIEAALAAPGAAGLAGRVDKIEAALAAPKTETRVAAEKPEAADNPAAVAIVAGALSERLLAGLPFATELKALQTLGVDQDKLATLKVLADGGPTDSRLAGDFDAVAPKVLAAASRPESGGVLERFVDHLRGLVQVRFLNETAGEDPAALVSQIEARSRRGDVSGALAAFARLPEPSRQAASGWATEAGAKQAADEAIRSIREAAIGKLAAGAKP